MWKLCVNSVRIRMKIIKLREIEYQINGSKFNSDKPKFINRDQIMIKIYCEDGAMTKEVKNLRSENHIKLFSFPFENRNRKTKNVPKPSRLTADSSFVTADSIINIGDTIKSNKFIDIEKVVGKENFNDIRHLDTAYKNGCQIFLTPDKKDIANKKKELEKILGISIFYCHDIDKIRAKITELKVI